MRARGPRDTHELVQMVRQQVALLVESTGKTAHGMVKLGRMVTALAAAVDNHEDRITALEAEK